MAWYDPPVLACSFETRLIKAKPKPPHSFLLGNIPTMAKITAKFPLGIHPHSMMPFLQKEYNLPSVFYLDPWPFGNQICAIVDPNAAMQVTVQHSLPKHHAALNAIAPLTGYNSLVTIEGKQHKKWRNIFNPGFSIAHLMTLVGGIVDDSLVFMDILGKHADANEMFLLEEAATRVTVDIIGRVVLYDNLVLLLLITTALISVKGCANERADVRKRIRCCLPAHDDMASERA